MDQSKSRVVAILTPKAAAIETEISCYNCKHGIWDEEYRINRCQHDDAAHAVACYCYNRKCPYFIIKD